MDKQMPFACPDCGKLAKVEIVTLLQTSLNPETGEIGTRFRKASGDPLYGAESYLLCLPCGTMREITIDYNNRRVTAIGESI